jgi:hypothetical protein
VADNGAWGSTTRRSRLLAPARPLRPCQAAWAGRERGRRAGDVGPGAREGVTGGQHGVRGGEEEARRGVSPPCTHASDKPLISSS